MNKLIILCLFVMTSGCAFMDRNTRPSSEIFGQDERRACEGTRPTHHDRVRCNPALSESTKANLLRKRNFAAMSKSPEPILVEIQQDDY